MRLLFGTGRHSPGDDLDLAALRELYVPPDGAWLRVNFVSTLDGAATGRDGRSGSINTEADHVVFTLLRELSDVVVVGAGTARMERYGVLQAEDASAPPLAVVSNSGALPERLLDGSGSGGVLLLTRAKADPRHLAAARATLGDDCVILCGTDEVDLAEAQRALLERGLTRVLSEGGPSLFGAMLAAGVVDELDLTWSPTIVGGLHTRIVAGAPLDVALEPMLLIEEHGTVMGRWRVLP